MAAESLGLQQGFTSDPCHAHPSATLLVASSSGVSSQLEIKVEPCYLDVISSLQADLTSAMAPNLAKLLIGPSHPEYRQEPLIRQIRPGMVTARLSWGRQAGYRQWCRLAGQEDAAVPRLEPLARRYSRQGGLGPGPG